MFSLKIYTAEEKVITGSNTTHSMENMAESTSNNANPISNNNIDDNAAVAVEDILRGLNVNGAEELKSSGPTKALKFSWGNPRVEEIKGVMHLYRNVFEPPAALESLPAGRSSLVCVLAVPNYMTYADFCQFTGSFIQNILDMRVVSILMSFDNQKSADDFYKHYNRRPFSSLEAEICHILYTADVQYTGSIEHAATPPTGLTELPTCPVCLERLDQDISGILTTVCNHSFHSSCISKWTDSSCPVCRYCQQEPEKSTCSICSTSENLWICVICGFVGCGRYKSGHAIKHWKETQHCYSLELETQRVWDYVGDNYVHRLIQSKTDGKLVELNTNCRDVGDGCGRCECSYDSGIESALFESKIEAISVEYNNLLTSQLENQRQYYDSLLAETKQQRDAAISEAVEKATTMKLQKLQSKVEKCIKENDFISEVNRNLIANQDLWKKKVAEIEKREELAIKVRDEKIADLEEQVRDLMVYIEAQKTLETCSNSAEIRDGTVLPMSPESTSKMSRRSGKSSRKKR
uniref:BRCA1-associated protein n=1 Tax=Araucaria cunninghamii TaxID=56994 RepID=A0A0D6R608_ARACU